MADNVPSNTPAGNGDSRAFSRALLMEFVKNYRRIQVPDDEIDAERAILLELSMLLHRAADVQADWQEYGQFVSKVVGNMEELTKEWRDEGRHASERDLPVIGAFRIVQRMVRERTSNREALKALGVRAAARRVRIILEGPGGIILDGPVDAPMEPTALDERLTFGRPLWNSHDLLRSGATNAFLTAADLQSTLDYRAATKKGARNGTAGSYPDMNKRMLVQLAEGAGITAAELSGMLKDHGFMVTAGSIRTFRHNLNKKKRR